MVINKRNSKEINILINNVVPLNNGDMALFYPLYEHLSNLGYSVKIATYYYKLAKEFYPNIPFVKELGQHKIFVKLPFLKPIALPILYLLSKPYKNADIIIGAPGGYVNSNYSIKSSLSIFQIAKFFGKKTAIYSQSIGPLNDKDAIFLKKLITNSIDFVFVRDEYSFQLLKRLNVKKSKYKLTKDAAFLLKFKQTQKNKYKKVAFSVREWSYENRSIGLYKKMVVEFVKICIDRGYNIDFLSTCQGLKNYKNDANLAQVIYESLEFEYQNKVNVLSYYYIFDDFYKKIEDYEFVIGTRLHMCITALTKNIPAFNISYEVKGTECYNYLGLNDYSIDYNEDITKAIDSLNNFIDKSEGIRNNLKNIIPKINEEVEHDFQFFMNNIILN